MTSLMSGTQPVKRDRYGRYLLPDPGEPGSTSDLPWTRVTTFVKAISEGTALGKWSGRMVAKGMAARPDLVLRAASVEVDDREVLGEIAEAAKEAAGSSTGRNLGSALHSFTESVDLGKSVTIPPPYDQDVAAYRDAFAAHGITVERTYVERIVVVKKYNTAGTFDRIVRWVELPDGTLAIGDLKTAKSLDYSWQEIAIQLGIYANGDAMWNPATLEYEPMPPVDKTRALVFHLPAGGRIDPDGTRRSECDVYEVDIAAGWEAAQLCADVRAWRKRKNIGRLLPKPPTVAELADLVAQAATPEALDELAAKHAARWSPLLAAVAAGRRNQLTDAPAVA